MPRVPKESIPRRTSQLLLDANNAMVLYDFDQHALVAMNVPDTLVMSPPRRLSPSPECCPLCHQLLTSPAPVPDDYFDTLGYMHKQGPLAMASRAASPSGNAFGVDSADTAATGLRNVSSSLLVNGYYSRFFEEAERLGSGSFGAVFRCRHVIDTVFLGVFAVKKVPVGDNREWLRGMMKEVKALERLASHPNIVAYKHSWLEMDRANELCPYVPYLFILMSYCDGGSLEAVSAIRSDATVWSLFLDIAYGLQHLHRNYVLHRDLKPSNILLTSDAASVGGWRAVLSDFGTSEMAGEINAATHTGFTGTIEYTAPEILVGDHVFTEQADLWSLGILLYALCYSAVPYSHADPQVCAELIRNHEILILPESPPRETH